jgi:hypothetical protein
MVVSKLKRIVISQQEEIKEKFQRENIIVRDIDLNRLKGYLSAPNILAILGIRRCGKSILTWQIIGEKTFPYINFDDERLIDFQTKDFDSLLEVFYELYGDFDTIVLDEIQNIKGWELFVNRLRRTKRVIITGSNSKLLSGELTNRLTGRYIDFVLFPFNFKEYLRYKRLSFSQESLYSTKSVGLLKKALEEYLKTGGLPEVYLLGRDMLVRIYGDILEKDVLRRGNIKKKTTFKELARYLVSNSSLEFSYSKLKNVFAIKDVHTIKNWVSLLQDSYLVFTLERFSFKLKEQFIAPKKLYCTDTGLFNTIGFTFTENIGHIMETFVAVELLRRRNYRFTSEEVYYWKDHQQREVDFVVKEGRKVKELIQVCYDIENPRTRERETKALLKAADELNCTRLSVITWDLQGQEKIQGKEIRFTPLYRWILEVP